MILKTACLLCLLLFVTANKPTDDVVSAGIWKDRLDSYCDSKSKGTRGTGTSESRNLKTAQESVDESIREHVLVANRAAIDAVDKLRAELKRILECPGVVHDYVCYYVYIDPSVELRINYYVAEDICRTDGAALANILSGSHYYEVVDEVLERRLGSPSTFVNFWTAMRRDIPSGKVYLSNGTLAPYVKEDSNSEYWSTEDHHQSYVYVSLPIDAALPHDSSPGSFRNSHASQRLNAVLCQYPISLNGSDRLNSYGDSRGKGSEKMRSSESEDFTTIQEYVNAALLKHSLATNVSISKELTNLKAELKEFSECNGIFYNYTCYWVIIESCPSATMDYHKAKAKCRCGRATLGDIYSVAQYDRIISIVLKSRHISPKSSIKFWTGMTREVSSGQVFLSDGTPAPFIGPVQNSQKWSLTDPLRQNVYVSVWTDGLSHDSDPGGFGNARSFEQLNAVLCQYPISPNKNNV